MNVLIVIVNYQTPDLAIDCLRSLEAEVAAVPGTRVVVTDNASRDASVAQLEAAVHTHGWGAWAEVQPLDRNGGFAFGNNAAIRPALASSDPPRYVWMLNPDTIVVPGALRAMVEFLDAKPEVGLAGTRVDNPDGSVQSSWFTFPSPATEFAEMIRLRVVYRLLMGKTGSLEPAAESSRVDWVSGASLFIRRAVFDAVGLLDEAYFMYFEEVDFCLRAARVGWPCWYNPGARIVHLAGQSSGVANPSAPRKRVPPYWFAARRRFFLTNQGLARTVLADLGWASAHVLYRLRMALLRRPVTEPKWIFWDFVRYNFLMMRW
jgi:GT2 family glycosyltransferase